MPDLNPRKSFFGLMAGCRKWSAYHSRNLFYALASGLLLYGKRASSIGIQSGFDSGKLFVINNSINYELQKSLRFRHNDKLIAALLFVEKKIFSYSFTSYQRIPN